MVRLPSAGVKPAFSAPQLQLVGKTRPGELAALDRLPNVRRRGEQLPPAVGAGGQRQRRRLALDGAAGREHPLQIRERLGVGMGPTQRQSSGLTGRPAAQRSWA